MRGEILLAIISKMVEERLEGLLSDFESKQQEKTQSISLRGLRGPQGEGGKQGPAGKDFNFKEHEETIRSWVKEFSLKFSDLSPEEIDSLKLKFSDLSPEEINTLKGIDGKGFIFSEHSEEINSLIADEINKLKPELKLKFSDLSFEDISQLRGPRGQRGRPGRDFNFEEHREFFESLKLKFSDLTRDEVESLKLKFMDLSPEERDSLKLKFSDLTFEEISQLKGPRGQRGRPGIQGESVIGPRGPIGPIGKTGISGKDGRDGKDAAEIYDVDVSQREELFSLIFKFTDGREIETPDIELPATQRPSGFMMIGGGGAASSVIIPPATPVNGVLIENVDCEESVFVGAAVRMTSGIGVDSTLADWVSLDAVITMDYKIFPDNIAVNALADTFNNSNVIGIVESKPATNKCNIRVSGVSGELFAGLLVEEEYYLSDAFAGKIVSSGLAPSATGTVLLKLGQPFSDKKFLVIKGERVVRL